MEHIPRLKVNVTLGHISTDALQSTYHTPIHKYIITRTSQEGIKGNLSTNDILHMVFWQRVQTHTPLGMKENVATNYVYQNCSLR